MFKSLFLSTLLAFSLLLAGCVGMTTSRPSSNVALARLTPYFQKAQVPFPPEQIALLVFKKERKLELWAKDDNRWHLIRVYPVLAESGGPGPKLQEGDDQVPEGVYKILGLNPQSHYHLSMDLNYPNTWDRDHARFDGRRQLGENIFIHGHAVSIGCIAVGDVAIEELFFLVRLVGVNHVEVIIAPDDLRHKKPLPVAKAPVWLPSLYSQIETALNPFG